MLECDDLLSEDVEYCSFYDGSCRDNRHRCKKADDFYHRTDGLHYFVRFIIYTNKVYDEDKKCFVKEFLLRDLQGHFGDVKLKDKYSAVSLVEYLYLLCDKIDELGGNSECLKYISKKD